MAETGTDQVREKAEEVTQGGDGGPASLAKRLLVPGAAGLGTLAATYAARKAPDLLRDKVMPRLERRSGEEVAKVGRNAASQLKGEGGMLGTVAGKAAEKLGGGGKKGREKTRRLPIQRWTDVAVPVATAYDKWAQFEEFPKFMHRVLSVEQKDDDRVSWQEKIWFSKRQWEGEITERRKNDRIAWKTVQGTSHSGVVSFHKLDDKLTRVMVTMDFRPSGIIEKMGSGLRFVKRAVQADLARFKAYVEMDEAEGLEYSQSGKDQQEQKEKDEKDQEEQAKEDGRGDGARSQSNGRGDEDESQTRTRDEADKAREERAERREQRQA
jgi:uncharacterized membrane protein